MKGDPLPDADHVVRYIRPSSVDDEEINGDAFLGKAGETACSINWLDYFRNQSKEQQLRGVRRHIRLDISPNGRFAELHVGQTKQRLATELVTLQFVEDPLAADATIKGDREDPSHALINGLPGSDRPPEFAEMIGDMIAACVIKPLHKAREE